MITPTIAEIKERTLRKSPHFFTRSTLKFWGQTMRSFRVRKSPAGRVFIFAPIFRRGDSGRPIMSGYTFREFTGDDLSLPRTDDDRLQEHDQLWQIEAYIKAH